MSKQRQGIFAWLWRPPAEAAGDEVKQLFQKVAAEESFRRVARLSEAECDTLQQELEAATTTFVRASFLQGGWADRDDQGGVRLGLSRWARSRAAAAHELFHLVRDLKKRMSLAWRPAEWSWNPLRWPRWLGDRLTVAQEECIVWTQTLHYAPVGGTMQLVGPFFVIGLVVAGILIPYRWLLGYLR